jgi:hypothetical protein
MLSETVLILVNFCTKNMRIGELTFAKSTFCQHLLHSFYSYNLEFLSIWPNVIQHFLSSLSNRNKINRCTYFATQLLQAGKNGSSIWISASKKCVFLIKKMC